MAVETLDIWQFSLKYREKIKLCLNIELQIRKEMLVLCLSGRALFP